MTAPGLRQARVWAVVLHYQDADDTVRCVRSLQRGIALDLGILVVDNGPADEAHEALVARLGPRVTCLATGENLGYSAGNNVGIRWALERRPEFVWILNPDTVVAEDTLAGLLATADDLGDAGVLGPRLTLGDSADERIWSDGGVVDARRYGATSNRHAGRPAAEVPPEGPVDVDYVPGASMLLRRTMLESVGLLPEEWFLYFEETDYCRRVRQAGWRTVLDDRVSMTHFKRSSGLLLAPYYLYYMTRNRLLFAERHFGASVDVALADFEAAFLHPWRRNVGERAPAWLPHFDALVAMAVSDARDGTWGRQPRVDAVPVAVLPDAGSVA